MPDFDADKVSEIHQHLHSHLPSEPALRVKALETLLVDKGLVNAQTIDAWVEAYTEEIGPKRGARVVAKAWCDPDFKKRLFEDAPAA
ncbi:MAG: nitrile hydratase subunit alpha, partial [Gammaproteobacteria bacterium]